MGHFCVAGTVSPTACPAGTFLNTTGGVSRSSCIPCTPSYFCGNTGLSTPTGSGYCRAGWYCSGGASTAMQYECPIGASCGLGSAAPLPCVPGTFNNRTLQSTCAPCPAGYLCDVPSTVTPKDCPAGYACAQGTGSLAAASRCPVGTFSSSPLLSLTSQCQTCTPGYYCDVTGLTAPAGLCAPGFLCSGGSSNAQGGSVGPPVVASTPCTAGGWCGAGSVVATPCPVKTYGNRTGYSAEANCSYCDAGTYCMTTGLVAPSGPCLPGYWCGRGNDSPNPVGGTSPVTIQIGSLSTTIAVGGDVCPPGSLCLAGSASPVPCPNGTYYPYSGQGIACATCPAGFWCGLGFATYNATPCAPGHACPPGTAYATQFPCPHGTFSNASGLQSISQCTPCSAGSYCAGTGSLTVTGPCSPGYVCYGGSSTPTPADNTTGVRCVAGEFCPSGATAVELCAGGQYCTNPTTGVPDGPCAPGYYCSSGSWTPTPGGELNLYDSPIGNICPQGHYCPSGTTTPLGCPVGTYSNSTSNVAASNCTSCLAGWQCDTTGLILPSAPCASRYYCPTGTVTVCWMSTCTLSFERSPPSPHLCLPTVDAFVYSRVVLRRRECSPCRLSRRDLFQYVWACVLRTLPRRDVLPCWDEPATALPCGLRVSRFVKHRS